MCDAGDLSALKEKSFSLQEGAKYRLKIHFKVRWMLLCAFTVSDQERKAVLSEPLCTMIKPLYQTGPLAYLISLFRPVLFYGASKYWEESYQSLKSESWLSDL